MRIDVVTLFPDLFAPFAQWSMIHKARKKKALCLKIHNLRKWGIDKRGTVDDHPYGGGPGMVLRPEPIWRAIKELKKKETQVILLSPKGKIFNQKMARKLARQKHLLLICGHYEGVDERVRKYLVDKEISVGKYIVSGGEIPAMIIIDALSRLQKGVLEKEGASEIESFSPGLEKMSGKKGPLLEYPHYTRPPKFLGHRVPPVLLSGNHKKIQEWRRGNIRNLKK